MTSSCKIGVNPLFLSGARRKPCICTSNFAINNIDKSVFPYLWPCFTLFTHSLYCFLPLPVHTQLMKHQLVQDKHCCRDADRHYTKVQISTSVSFRLRCCVSLPEVLLSSETLVKASPYFSLVWIFFSDA